MINATKIGARSIYAVADVATVGTTPAVMLTHATSSNTIYMVEVSIVGVTPSGGSVVFRKTAKIANIGGVLTAGIAFDAWDDPDASLLAAEVLIGVSGANIAITVTGVAATNMTWSGAVDIVSGAF